MLTVVLRRPLLHLLIGTAIMSAGGCAAETDEATEDAGEAALSGETAETLTPATSTRIGAELLAELDAPDTARWRRVGSSLTVFSVVLVELRDPPFQALGQFRDTEAALREVGVPVTRIADGFFASDEANVAALDAALRRTHAEHGGKPLLVLGNPQTGPDTLLTVLRHPELLTSNVVGKLALVQPAFGTPLIDAAQDALSHHDGLSSFVESYFGGLTDKFSRRSSRARFEKAIGDLSSRSRALLDDRTYFIASYSPTLLRTNPAFAIPYAFLGASGLTDGVSMTNDQSLGSVGHRLGIVPADHWDLFGSLPVSASPSSTRRAFTRVLFRDLVEQ